MKEPCAACHPAPTVPPVSLREYIRRDLAYTHGIDRMALARLDQVAPEYRSSTHRQWDIYAGKAEISVIDWIAGNAPGAIPHLRAAGLIIPATLDNLEET